MNKGVIHAFSLPLVQLLEQVVLLAVKSAVLAGLAGGGRGSRGML